LENLGNDDYDDDNDDDVHNNRAWESIRENTEASATEGLGYYELKGEKPWFREES
jgi:hypothetical protein